MTPANAAILPGDLLPYRELYQQVAGSLPSGTLLVVLPRAVTRQRTALELLARQLQCAGHPVTTLIASAHSRTGSFQARLPFAV